MVFPVCDRRNDCAIHVVYNLQIPLCVSTEAVACRKPHELCVADDKFDFDMRVNTKVSLFGILKICIVV